MRKYFRDKIGRFASHGTSKSQLQPRPEGVKVNSDGSMYVPKGTVLQKIVSSKSDGQGNNDRDPTMSFFEYDNAMNIKWGTGYNDIDQNPSDTILRLSAKTELKAPSRAEATSIFVDTLKRNPEFRASIREYIDAEGYHGREKVMTEQQYKTVVDNPSGEEAKNWYRSANVAMQSLGWDPKSAYITKTFGDALDKKGYSMVRAESDNGWTLGASVIIPNRDAVLSVVSIESITEKLMQQQERVIQEYEKRGYEWFKANVYAYD